MLHNTHLAATLIVCILLSYGSIQVPAQQDPKDLIQGKFFYNRSVCRDSAKLILNFPCQEHGRCIGRELICDGIRHCLNGIDEISYNECVHGQSEEGIRCLIKNSNTTCFLPKMYMCDGIGHCHNNHDECNCNRSSTFFKCSENECVHNSTLCDGVTDCSNGADERMINNNVTSTSSSDVRCKTAQGNICLLDKAFVCDGHVHCQGNTDECSCPHNNHYFRCLQDECVHNSAVCNGKKECSNGLDEQYSTLDLGTNGYLPSNHSDGIYCYANSKKVSSACFLPTSMVCDGIAHCRGSVDECAGELCVDHRSKYFKCGQSYQCVKTSQVCDAKPHCTNGHDEQQIDPSQHTFDSNNFLIHNVSSGFKCPLTKSQCLLPTAQVCDGVSHCLANTDECNCPNTTYNFNCGNGECFKSSQLFCNKHTQCSNGRDELPFSRKSEGFRCLQYNSKLSYRVCDLPLENVCDGVVDCYDFSDETVCGKDYFTHRHFKCLDGRKVILGRQLCDGIIDCFDMSDECEICGNPIPVCSRICGNNNSAECIPKYMVCNQVVEYDIDETYCSKLEQQHSFDEIYGRNVSQLLLCCNQKLDGCENSSLYNRMFCEKSLFRCKPSKTKNQKWIGIGEPEFAIADDGIMTCKNGEDECHDKYNVSLVPSHPTGNYSEKDLHYYRCAIASRKDTFGSEICNGKFRGYNDETYCSNKTRFHCNDANKDPVSVHKSKQCDLIADCLDASDEAKCSNLTHFYCQPPNRSKRTQFVSREKVCDGREDCLNGHDECQNCNPSPFSDDNRLISSVFLRVIVWISALVAIFGNIFAIGESVYNFYINYDKMELFSKNSKVQLLSLSVADLLVGIYLLSVALSDVTLGKYCLADRKWRSSNACSAMGVFGYLGSQVSVFSMLLLTLARYFTIKNPFLRFRVRYSVLGIACIWFMGLLMALIPISPGTKDYFVTRVAYNNSKFWPLVSRSENSKFLNAISLRIKTDIRPILENTQVGAIENATEYSWKTIFKAMEMLDISPKFEYGYYSTHGVCISNLYPNKDVDKSWAYTTFVMVLNFLIFIGIACTYVLIYRYTLKTGNKVSSKSSNAVLERLQKRISIIIITDFCCWIPICITSFIGLSGVSIPGTMFAVTAIVILPINSALNPIIYSSIPEKIYNLAVKSKLSKLRSNDGTLKSGSESLKSTRMTSVKSNTTNATARV